jgi:hypothetical protein
MKIIIFNTLVFICLLLVFPSCANRRSQENGAAKDNKPMEKKTPGKIVFDKEIHNFGTLKDGEIVSFSFIFRNAGESPFTINKVEKTCGCIDFRYNSNAIRPGETSSVELIFNTAGEWGNQIKSVTVETSDGEQKDLQIGAYIENKQFNNLLNTEK